MHITISINLSIHTLQLYFGQCRFKDCTPAFYQSCHIPKVSHGLDRVKKKKKPGKKQDLVVLRYLLCSVLEKGRASYILKYTLKRELHNIIKKFRGEKRQL